MNNIEITVIDNQEKFSINTEKIEQNAHKIFSSIMANKNIISQSILNNYDLNLFKIYFDILISDNKEIKKINKEYRFKDKPTDVISFALFADSEEKITAGNEIFLGDIIISAEMTQVQALENKKTFDDEFYYLLSHGILHLLGFDHLDEESLISMLEIQDNLVSLVK